MDVTRKSLDEIDDAAELENMRKIEAALFISGKFLSVKELVALTDVNPILLKKILEDLQEKYNNSGISIVQKNDLWKMDVASEYAWLVNRLASGNSEFSNAEQETLAIIAYKQPIKQSILIKIRGNKGYDHIKKFVELGLIMKKKLGHTSELTLSESFHDYFNVGDNEISSLEGGENKENLDIGEK